MKIISVCGLSNQNPHQGPMDHLENFTDPPASPACHRLALHTAQTPACVAMAGRLQDPSANPRSRAGTSGQAANPYNKPEPPYVAALFPLTHNPIFPILALPKSEFLSVDMSIDLKLPFPAFAQSSAEPFVLEYHAYA